MKTQLAIGEVKRPLCRRIEAEKTPGVKKEIND